MLILRSAIFDVFFYAWTFFCSVVGVTLTYLPNKKPLRQWARVWSRGLGFLEETILDLHYVMPGRETLPQTPCIFAVQHQSAWDTFKLLVWFPDAAIVMKEELIHIPLWGTTVHRYGGIPVKRSKKAEDLKSFLREAKAMVAAGRAIALFPQGTRTLPGAPAHYNKGVAILAEELHLPVIPVTLDSGKFWPRGAFLKHPGTVQVRVHPPIPPGTPRAELMSRLRALFEGAPPAV